MTKYRITGIIIVSIVIFFIKQSSGQYTKLFDYTNAAAHGCYPKGSLISDSTYLYGMTTQGGTHSCGLVFKIKQDGSEFTKLHDFEDSPDGNEPHGGLISDGAYLYGMTYRGGIHGMGTIFKIKPDGTAYEKIFDFSGISNGSLPEAGLHYDGTYLYGTTIYGGLHNLGTAFKIKPDGTDFTKLYDFAGISNGKYPKGSLITDGTYLYGCASEGGANNKGTLFRIKTDGSDYAKLIDFAGQTNGECPQGLPLCNAGNIFIATKYGGGNYYGSVIKIKTDGTAFKKIFEFVNTVPTGVYPVGSLVSDGTYIYGVTLEGGTSSFGVIYKVKPDGTGFAKILDFSGSTNGSLSYGSYIIESDVLYGFTSQGGSKDMGTIFKFTLSTDINCYNVEKTISIYPNPGSNQMIVNNPPLHTKILLYDITGKLQKEQQLDLSNMVNTGELDTGIYFYRIIDSKGKMISTGKWVKCEK
jgi:uncharacterized repeat protein (TIGR03803 family)